MRTIAAIICVLAMMLAQRAVAQQACPTLLVATADDEVNGNTSSPCALIANPGSDGISLREALLAANNATGSGTITITFVPSLAGATIALTAPFAPVTRSQITLTGLTHNGQPNITLDATNASNPGAILFIAASSFTMTGMNIINLPTNAMQIGGFSYNQMGQMVSSPAQICCFHISGNAFSNGTGGNTFGIYVPANDSNETIADVNLANNSFSQLFEGINIQGGGPSVSNSVIEDVVVFGNTFSQMTSSGTSAVEVSAGPTNDTTQRVQIVQNTFTDNFQGFVIDMSGTSSGNMVQDVTVARNVFSGNLGALGVVAGVNSESNNNTVLNTQIVDNLIDLTGYQGNGSATIQVIDSQSGGTNDKVTGVSFVNNTIYNGSSASPPGWGVWVTSSGGVSGVSIENTIFWGNETAPPLNGIASPSQVSHSIIDQSGFSGVNNNINVDPLFVNPPQGNFELQSGSPALHAGTNNGAPAIDIACQQRGAPPSIGAFEFAGPDICPATYSPPLPLNATPASGHGPLAVIFRTSGLSHTKSYIINFGDGTTGPVTQHSCIGLAPLGGGQESGQGGILCAGSASHTYAAAGTYTATLVNVSGGSLGSSVTITVGGARPLAGGGVWWRQVAAPPQPPASGSPVRGAASQQSSP
jgi:hypothetical protein